MKIFTMRMFRYGEDFDENLVVSCSPLPRIYYYTEYDRKTQEWIWSVRKEALKDSTLTGEEKDAVNSQFHLAKQLLKGHLQSKGKTFAELAASLERVFGPGEEGLNVPDEILMALKEPRTYWDSIEICWIKGKRKAQPEEE